MIAANADVEDALDRVLTLEVAYPQPLLPNVLKPTHLSSCSMMLSILYRDKTFFVEQSPPFGRHWSLLPRMETLLRAFYFDEPGRLLSSLQLGPKDKRPSQNVGLNHNQVESGFFFFNWAQALFL